MLYCRKHPLKELNTFGVQAYADEIVFIDNLSDLPELVGSDDFFNIKKLILGGGSNILFTRNFDGLIIAIRFKGIEVIGQTDSHVYVKAMAGEVWDDLVAFCVSDNLGGIENLTMIPGNVGAAPIQNIGAYGVEIGDVLHWVEAFDIESGQLKRFSNQECEFGYRDSIFKKQDQLRYIILSVCLKLTRVNHVLKLHYGNLEKELKGMGVGNPGIRDVMDAVRNIRQSKLPDVKVTGNAGSFFKNPVVTSGEFERLRMNWPEISGYPDNTGNIKIAAGWLIEKAGWKGYRLEDAGVHVAQALVLVNHGNATGEEILALSRRIQDSVYKTFGLNLIAEVNIV